VELRRLLAPILRRAEQTIDDLVAFRRDFEADLALWEAMPNSRCAVLDVPILAVLGQHDAFVTERAMVAWQRQTTAEFSLELLPGDHFYVHQVDARAVLMQRLTAAIQRSLLTRR
jgi:surfactin synthase thioesterase subunit